jgi:hypothetical protein
VLSESLRDLACLQATGTDVGAPGGAVVIDPNALEIGVEAALAGNHRVASAVAESRTTAAGIADLGHGRRKSI